MQITIVGAGHYGRNLIGPKYIKNPYATLKAIISPTINEHVLLQSALRSVPLYRTADEWVKNFGSVCRDDVFDLCLPAPKIPVVLTNLVNIGARNFIFPKPIAQSKNDLLHIWRIKEEYGLRIAVASQWHSAEITKQLKFWLTYFSKNNTIRKVLLNFSGFQSDDKLKNYAVTSVFIPHLLQILYSTGIFDTENFKSPIVEIGGPYSIIIRYESTVNTPKILLVSDVKSKIERREVLIYSDSYEAPAIVGNYLDLFKNGKICHSINLKFQNKIELIIEDVLETMLNKILIAFEEENVVYTNKEIMTFDSYLPIAQAQLEIEQRFQDLLQKNGGV